MQNNGYFCSDVATIINNDMKKLVFRLGFLMLAMLLLPACSSNVEDEEPENTPNTPASGEIIATNNESVNDSIPGYGIDWDVAPINYLIMVEDAQGNDLLDKAREDNIINKITVNYLGTDYFVNTARTRTLAPIFRGLTLNIKTHGDNKADYYRFMLQFGEFDGGANVDLREIKLDMGDGNILTLAYKNSFKWNSNGEPDIDRTFYLNGEAVNNPDYVYHFQYTSDGKLTYLP